MFVFGRSYISVKLSVSEECSAGRGLADTACYDTLECQQQFTFIFLFFSTSFKVRATPFLHTVTYQTAFIFLHKNSALQHGVQV